jgi:spoIIIJ-associated protein
MDTEEIQNLIKELIEKTTVKLNQLLVDKDDSQNTWFRAEVGEPHFFTLREGEGLAALNHLVRRIIETKTARNSDSHDDLGIFIDVNDFQKKRVENIRAVAHMMSERARYFKSNIEIDPMTAFERRIVHEFLAKATDLKTESVGFGPARRVVIKYIGTI